jgi:hypothetical protein
MIPVRKVKFVTRIKNPLNPSMIRLVLPKGPCKRKWITPGDRISRKEGIEVRITMKRLRPSV